MIKILNTKSNKFEKELNYYLNLRKNFSVSKLKIVKKIIKDIRNNKDSSLKKYEKKFNYFLKMKYLNTLKI